MIQPPEDSPHGGPADRWEIDLSVVIPSYNEATRLERSLPVALDYLQDRGLSFEVLVVDDGSQDDTSAVAASFADRGTQVHRLDRNAGKGAASRHGVGLTRGRRVLLSDADFSTPIEDLAKLEPHLDSADLVLGSRAVEDSNVTRRQPLYRSLMGKIFNKIIRVLAVRTIHDTQCGFKLLDGEVARSLFADILTTGFAFDVELVWLAQRRGLRVKEVGVRWEDSTSSRVSPLRDPPRMLWDVVRFRWLHRRRVNKAGAEP